MSGLKTVLRHGFVGGGVATLLLAGLFVFAGDPTGPVMPVLAGWLAVVGFALLLAGTRERVTVAGRTVGWPRVAAGGIAVLGIGAAGFGVAQLRSLETASGPWLLAVAVTVFGIGYVAWFALECWAGGRRLDEEMFAVE